MALSRQERELAKQARKARKMLAAHVNSQRKPKPAINARAEIGLARPYFGDRKLHTHDYALTEHRAAANFGVKGRINAGAKR